MILKSYWGIFEVDEIKEILGELGEEGPGEPPEPPIDKAAELQEKWGVNEGDIWQIESNANPGRYHRLICGDCRDATTVEAVTEGQPVNGIFTSPPYAMQRAKQYGGVPADEYVEWWEAVQGNMREALAEDGSFFVNINPLSESIRRQIYVDELILFMVSNWKWEYIDEFCWLRTGIPGSPEKMGKFKNQWEPIFWFSKNLRPKFHPGNVRHFSDKTILDNNWHPTLAAIQGTGRSVLGRRHFGEGQAYPGNVLKFLDNSDGLGHSAAFPLKLPTFFIKAYSDPLDTWLDPFAGSGTTALAAENESRLGLMIEKLPKYCSVILERLQSHIGTEPELIK